LVFERDLIEGDVSDSFETELEASERLGDFESEVGIADLKVEEVDVVAVGDGRNLGDGEEQSSRSSPTGSDMGFAGE
jgi:hypothetical protein